MFRFLGILAKETTVESVRTPVENLLFHHTGTQQITTSENGIEK